MLDSDEDTPKMSPSVTPLQPLSAEGLSTKRIPLPRSLWIALGIVYVGAVASVLLCLFLAQIKGLSCWEPLYPSYARFDFFCFLPRFMLRHTVQFYVANGYPWYYPAPALWGYYPFYKLTLLTNPLTAYTDYVLIVIMAVLGLAGLLARRLYKEGLCLCEACVFSFGMVVCSWPIYFALQRGNIEAFTWILLAVGIWALRAGNKSVAAVLIGAAGSIKLYPLVFIALFLRRRQWEAAALSLAVALIVTLASLYYIDPHLRESWALMSAGVGRYTKDYSKTYGGATWDHSLFGLLKDVLPHRSDLTGLLKWYYVAAAAIGLALFVRVYRMPELNMILLLTCAAITLTPTSFDYTLTLLYIPLSCLALFATQAARRAQQVRGLALTLGLLACSLTPLIFTWNTDRQELPGALKTCCLLACMGVAVVFPFLLPNAAQIERTTSPA